MKHLENHDILTDCQFGFQTLHSCEYINWIIMGLEEICTAGYAYFFMVVLSKS